MKIAICDDEARIREEIARKIKKLYPEILTCLFENGYSLLESGERFDIIFLDIQMEGINGIDTARMLRKQGNDALIIFVTALKEYVFEAFDVETFHYLVKPFSNAKFYEVLHMAVKKRQKEAKRKHSNIPEGGEGFDGRQKDEKSILLKIGRTTSKVYVKTIIYAEVFNRKIVLHTTDREFEFYGKMNDLEQRLGDEFFRCHRAYLVQLRYVSRYDANSILLENGVTVSMAKQKYEAFVRRYFDYARKEEKQN